MEEKLDRIIELLETIANNTGTSYKGYPKWDEAQEEFLIDLYNQEVDIPEMISAIKDKFDIDRSQGAIVARLSKLDLVKSRKRPVKKENTLDGIYDEGPLF